MRTPHPPDAGSFVCDRPPPAAPRGSRHPLTSPGTVRAPRARRFVLGAAALALAVTGCATPGTPGASSSSSGTTTPSPASSASRSSETPAAGDASTSGGGASAGATASSSDEAQDATRDAAAGTALAALGELPVKGRAPKTGYSRDEFGPRWADTDHNGCDTRNDILRRDMTGIEVTPGTHGCKVRTGTLVSPYSGGTVDFTAGQDTSSEVQIDHVVALSDAWQKGAQQLDADRRTALANDPLNLLAVDGPTNNKKSDGDAATWLPPATSERCEYVATQIAVKRSYDLWVTDGEKKAMVRVLDTCPDQKVPEARAVPAPVDEPVAAPQTEAPAADQEPAAPVQEPVEQAPAVPGANGGVAGGDVYYSRCAEARAAGAAPLYAGSPGYRPGLDGDGDGVACEAKH
ncbi:DUF1524 domain-containing protein [Glutamicibacter protophormiae]|uniref:Excalibur calcium-binding domain-containing protein n=1 Tax=Kocuria varians TaxID=1272 RepID=A0A7D7L238_KOCVA|nr:MULTISPECIES: DUF1524 domain-containing protein [Kocuria]QMS55684.1 hypothetical protein CIB50_0000373 [Kocuria varians]WNB88810.1 DUF1524 domain-containing protein [Glutamicibacter protophormiae]